LGWLGVVLAALALAGAGAVSLAADLNASRAARPAAVPDLEASAEAVRLAPWRADYRRDHASRLWQAGNPGGSRQQLEAALRYAPADPALWMQYQFELAYSAPLDPMLPLAAGRVAALGPNEPELQLAQADLAVRTWHQVGEEMHRAWLPSLRYALAHDHDAFLLRSFRAAGESNLCSAAAALDLQQWCGNAMAARMVCARGELTPGQERQCHNWGAAAAVTAPAGSGGAR
jgi:hypothetical protein